MLTIQYFTQYNHRPNEYLGHFFFYLNLYKHILDVCTLSLQCLLNSITHFCEGLYFSLIVVYNFYINAFLYLRTYVSFLKVIKVIG